MLMDGAVVLPSAGKTFLEWLKLLKDEEITDIRKIYKNGVTDSVFEKYQNYVNRNAG